jgi:recombination protein RecA
VGNRTRVTVKKNKVAPPFRVAEFDIMYNEGISTAGDLIDLGVENDIVTKRGSFYSLGDVRLGQGRESAKEYLRQNPDVAAEIDQAVRVRSGLVAAPDVAGLAGLVDGGEGELLSLNGDTPVSEVVSE